MTISHHSKVRVVIDCSLEERAYIKMSAARRHMTISEYILALAKEELESKLKVMNKTTLEAHEEVLDGEVISYESLNEFWTDIGLEKRVKS